MKNKYLKFELPEKKVEKLDNPLVFPLRDPASKNEFAENQGIDLLSYFIAHAPSEPQWDFDVPMETERPKSKFDDLIFDEMKIWDEVYKSRKAKMWASEWARVQLIERKKYL